MFTGNSIYLSGADYYFDPALANIGLDTIHLSYSSVNNCVRDTFEVVTTDTVPNINFTVNKLCIQPGLDTTKFINLTTSKDSVIGWSWNFEDPASGLNNTSSLKNPKHLYQTSERRDVSLAATTIKGCSASREIAIRFGEAPMAAISWQSECFSSGEAVHFLDKSTTNPNTVISSYAWKIYDNNSIHYFNSQNPTYTFSEDGVYSIELKVGTDLGCFDSTTTTFNLRPTYNISEGTYEENFEAQPMVGWDIHAEASSEANSWTLGLPIGDIFTGVCCD